MERQIIHIDITSFAVSVERIRDPRLRGRPVIVAFPDMERSLVYTASPEAQGFGIRSGMTLQLARKLCRDISVIPPNQQLYQRATAAIWKILSQFTPSIESMGHGRAFLDMTGTSRLFGPGVDVAARVQREIHSQLRLESTLGIATNKLVSKIASAVIRPVTLQDVAPGSEENFIAPFAVHYLPNIDELVKRRLLEFNIRIIRQIAALPFPQLTLAFGRAGVKLYQASHGIDEAPVRTPQQIPCVFEEHTLAEDSNDLNQLRSILHGLIERAALRLRQSGRAAKKIFLEIEYSDHRKAFGVKTLSAPCNTDKELFAQAELLLKKYLTRRIRVRKLGARLSHLAPASPQLSLFASKADAKDDRLARAMDHIRTRFGDEAIQLAIGV